MEAEAQIRVTLARMVELLHLPPDRRLVPAEPAVPSGELVLLTPQQRNWWQWVFCVARSRRPAAT